MDNNDEQRRYGNLERYTFARLQGPNWQHVLMSHPCKLSDTNILVLGPIPRLRVSRTSGDAQYAMYNQTLMIQFRTIRGDKASDCDPLCKADAL